MVKSLETLNANLDDIYPPTGNIGFALLLYANLVITTATLDASTDTFTTTSTDPGYLNGSRIRLTTTGTLPNVSSGDPISSAIDYYCIKVTDNTFKLARTQAQALSNDPILFSDAGTGTLTFTEQILNVEDPLAVLVNKEVNHPNYYRYAITDVGNAVGAQKSIVWAIPVTSGNPAITYRHKLVIIGGSSTIGDTTGTKDHLMTEVGDITVFANQTATLGITFRLANS